MKFTYATGQQPLEGYTIKRGIGRGGFGEVYFGVSARGKEVALKLIQANIEIELRGIQQCLNLKHPNLVHLYDLRTDAHGDHWLIMEHLAGDPLNVILARHPSGVSAELARQWFLGLAAAVHHLHDHGIVHRDLKPGNIFLDSGFIKVGDYGLCKTLGQSPNLKQTQSVGTVHYMAPELATGNYSHQVDIYAAGIILYEMLTGQVPFDGESVAEILFKHQTQRPDLGKVPQPFVPILDSALCKNPAQRCQSMSALRQQVESMLGTSASPLTDVQGSAATVVRPRLEAPTQLLASPYQRLARLSGPLLAATLLAAVSAFALSGLFRPDTWKEVFFLTTLSAAAVLVPANLWARPVEESWTRRLLFMGLGLLIGLAALWYDGFQLPVLGGADADSLRPLPANDPEKSSSVFSLLYSDNRRMPLLVCYLSYFGLMFLALRWWKMGEDNRRQRLSVKAVLATAFWAYILLFLLPTTHQRQEGFLSMVLTSVIIQLVSPWQPLNQDRSKKLRLQGA